MKIKSPLIQFLLNSATDYEIRVETLNGREHWVLPVIMMAEGVHHGSRGPLLYTATELGRFTSAWNGIPVTVGHPQIEGDYVSANLPELAEGVVGRIFNCRMEGLQLRAEAWVDVTALQEVSGDAFEYIKEKKALEVSVGVFSEERGGPGELNGERYETAAINLRPDHLALLPNETGACSWDDGCGIRVNKTKNFTMKVNKNKSSTKDVVTSKADFQEALLTQGYGIHLISNEAGFREIMSLIQNKLNGLDNDLKVYYLEDIYDDTFIYRVSNRMNGESEFYRQEYSVQEDNSIEFDGNPARVRKDVSFVNLTKHVRTNFSNNKTKQEQMKTNATPCSVDALIKNKALGFTEDDRAYLSTLSQERITGLSKTLKVNDDEEEEEEEEVQEVTSNSKKKTTKPMKKVVTANVGAAVVEQDENGVLVINGKSIEEIVKGTFSKYKTPEQFIDNVMPEQMRGQMKAALKVHGDNRKKMVDEIVANSKFKEEQLKNWSDADLQALAESLNPAGDYSANRSTDLSNEDEATSDSVEAITAMLSFDQPKAKETEKK